MTKRLTDAEIEALPGLMWNVDYWKIEDADLHPLVRTIESAVLERSKEEPVAVVELVTQSLRAMPDGTWWQQDPQLEIRAIRPIENGQRLYAAPQAVNQRLLKSLKELLECVRYGAVLEGADAWVDCGVNAREAIAAAERGGV